MMNESYPYSYNITKFPKPPVVTPYKTFDFDLEIKNIHQSKVINSTITSKVIIIGDVYVGKTSLIRRFCQNSFETNYKTTIGVDFEIQQFAILDIPFTMQIWDTAGQERFRCIATAYYRGAHAIIIVFDTNCVSTLHHCQQWLKEALDANIGYNPFIFLVGTKKDLLRESQLALLEEEANNIASLFKAELWIVSALSGHNIVSLFHRIAALTFNKILNQELKEEPVKNIINLRGDSIIIKIKDN